MAEDKICVQMKRKIRNYNSASSFVSFGEKINITSGRGTFFSECKGKLINILSTSS